MFTLNVLVRPIFGRLGLLLVVFSVLLFAYNHSILWRIGRLTSKEGHPTHFDDAVSAFHPDGSFFLYTCFKHSRITLRET